MNAVTLGAPWRCPSWAIGCLCLTFCCTTGLAGRQGPAISWCSSSLHLPPLSEILGSSGPWGSCSNANIHCSSSSKHLCALHTSVASWRALSIFTFRAVRKIHPTLPAAVHAALFSKWELAASPFQCSLLNLALLPSLPPESTPRGQWPHGTICYLGVTGFLHPVKPQALLPAGYPATSFPVEPQKFCWDVMWIFHGASICWVSCRVRQLYRWSYLWYQLSCYSLFSLFTEPRIGKVWVKRLEEDLRSHRNSIHFFIFFSPGWCSNRSSSHNIT